MSDAIRHIVVLGAQPEWLSGLRGPLIRDFLARGYRVTAIGAEEMAGVRAKLESWGAEYAVVPLRRAGLNPLSDLRAIIALYRLFRRLRPDLLFAYTVKPIVYGLPAAWAARVPRRYAMIAGRGYAFHEGPERSRPPSRASSKPSASMSTSSGSRSSPTGMTAPERSTTSGCAHCRWR